MGGSNINLQVSYPYMAEALKSGSQALLERVWGDLPLQLHLEQVDDNGVLGITINADGLVDEDSSKRCVQQIVFTRVWLLIGPLVERLRWLRDQTSSGKRNTTVSAVGQVPPALSLHLRKLEQCWIVCKPDRVVIIFTVHLDDEVDVALGRTFCLEFAEARSEALPCSFSDSQKDEPPADLRGSQVSFVPNVGYLIFPLSDQVVRSATDERLISLAQPVMTFRNFFNFHLKMTKSYLHSRLRKKIEGWQQTMKSARRAPRKGQEIKRRTVTGKEFVQNA